MNFMNKKDSQIKKKNEFIMLILQNVNVKIIESYTWKGSNQRKYCNY